jgi:hypothetical protein
MFLEDNLPLSHSLIWRRQREFYIQRGWGAWSADKVPQFITNNPFIAEIYAGIAFQFLQECIEQDRHTSAPISPGKPLRILELGAGTGKFAYLFLRHLASLMSAQRIPWNTVRYCMSDCSDGLVETWRCNSYLAEFVQSGILEFRRFAAGESTDASGLLQGSSPGPLVLIANYVFDSLPQDAFVVHDGSVQESLVTTAVPGPTVKGQTPADAPPLSTLQLSWHSAPVSPERYADALWNRILDQYRSRVPRATVLFPAAALEVLKDLGELSDGRMLVLAADKGHAHEEVLALVQGPPKFEWHAGDCFSLMVNFDAIGKYFRAIGGEPLLPDKRFSGLSLCGFLRRRSGDDFPATISAYRHAQSVFGPDDLFTLLAWLNAHMEEMTVPQMLATLRLTRWDPIALMRLFPVLGRQLRSVTAERFDLRDAVLRTWANHYPVEHGENVLAFDCGVILLELGFFSEAMAMFKTSQQVFGPSAATSYNLGLCAQGLELRAEALTWMVEACRLDSNFEPARSARLRLEKEIAVAGSAGGSQ